MNSVTIKNQTLQYTKLPANVLAGKNVLQNHKQQNFNGVIDVATTGLQCLKANPMLEVSAIDMVSAIAPRTMVDLKTGVPAAFETFRRESSGLLVNCLIPSVFVLGIGKLINGSMMKDFKNADNKVVDMSASWANQDALEKLSSIYSNADAGNKTRNFVKNTLESLEGFDSNVYKPFAQSLGSETLDEVSQSLSDVITNTRLSPKETKKAISKVYRQIVDKTKAAETIRFIGDEKAFSSNLTDLLRDQVDLGRKFLQPAVSSGMDAFKKKAVQMVNAKSLMGLGIVIPLAMSVQSINRAITRLKYKQKGAPIYKDFGKGNTHKEMTGAEKSKFFVQKCLAASAMVGLAVLSMMKKPNLKMLQFKGMFPTIDQCRWVAAATFASRMFVAEDPNELRESVVRDVATFSGLYFLGDYIEKATATLVEKVKPDIKLINRLVPDDAGKNVGKRLWNWVKNYKLKSFDEVTGSAAKNMRSVSQLAGLAFSIVSLGILLPRYNRSVTEKKMQRAKEAEKLQGMQGAKLNNYLALSMPKAFQEITK